MPNLFEFNLSPTGLPRTWRNVLQRDRFRATLTQNREPRAREDLGAELVTALREAIEERIRATPNIAPHHTFHFTMQSDHFDHAFQSTTFTIREFQEDSDRLNTYFQSLAEKLNSNEDFEADGSFTIETTFIRNPGTGGKGKRDKGRRLGRTAIDTLLKTKKSIIRIENTDNLCCARAIVTMKAFADASDVRDPDYVNLRKGRPIQERRARELHALAGVAEDVCGIPELQAFQRVLTGYQIKVLSIDKPHMIIFQGPDADKKILLVKVDDHYHGCNSFGGFLDTCYFCHDCNRGYSTEDMANHQCDGKWCVSCYRPNCPDYQSAKQVLARGQLPEPTVLCLSCNRLFMGDDCLLNHSNATRSNRSTCEVYKKCPACCCVYEAAPLQKNGRISNKYKHKCGWAECPFCLFAVDQSSHRCYIQPIEKDEDEPKYKKVPAAEVDGRQVFRVNDDGSCVVAKNTPLFVYADYEAMTDEEGVQTPILVCCESAEEEDTRVFYGEFCTEALFEYLDDLTVDDYGDDRKVIIVFHNFRGYDGMFVLKYLYDNHREVTNQVTIGTKILSMSNGNLTFKDSLCFLPFPLSAFSVTFGIAEMCKGFFPHLFNTAENQRYEGPMPDVKYYDPDGMSEKKKREFLTWHAAKVAEDYNFKMRKEMEDYCISDVKLLKAGCQKFQDEFNSHADFNPMEKCITIASACNRFWRKKQLLLHTIAVEPPRGWFGARTNTSVVAQEWLAYQNQVLRSRHGEHDMVHSDRIRTATNGGEVRVFTPAQSYLVDGFDETTRTVYEFHGCLWHGCPTCFPYRFTYSKFHRDRTFQEVHEATLKKEAILRAEGYTVQSIWECEWKKLKEQCVAVREFMRTYEIVTPLNPRHAFFGGRTNAVQLYHQVDSANGEVIEYVDVTSLYPWVNATCKYPLKHPEIITNPTDHDIHQYFGVAKVDVLPPRQLFHPVLPHRQGGKLTFPLCSKCVQEEMEKPFLERSAKCGHSDAERMLRGTWCTPELIKAVEKGYVIVKIHEVWHFPNTEEGLFRDYVKQWLKIKQESSGYPAWADTEDKKRGYREDYLHAQGILLEDEFLVKNPGRKATAKLMLNSFWGKFGENLDKSSVEAVTAPAGLFSLINDNTHTVQNIRICNADLLEVVIKEDSDNIMDNGKRNIFIAAFTTCHARLKLYSYLEQLGEQVLYFDTDSVIYKRKPGQVAIPLGDYLGEMTNELDNGDHIVEFVSGGPKNYGHRTKDGKVCCKVRGFTLNVRGSQQLNYNVMKDNVIAEIQDPQDTRRLTDVNNPNFFTRHPATKRIKIVPRKKQYGLVFDKRVVDPNTFVSYPYGYESLDDELLETLMSL